MSIRQRAIYYYLIRHTRLVGSESTVFALLPLANALDIAESTARKDLRDLHTKGCIRIEERSRLGHLVRVLLPHEMDGILVDAGPAETVDLEALDFFSDRRFVDVLLVREAGRCLYCLTPRIEEAGPAEYPIPAKNRICNPLRINDLMSSSPTGALEGVEGAQPFFIPATERPVRVAHT